MRGQLVTLTCGPDHLRMLGALELPDETTEVDADRTVDVDVEASPPPEGRAFGVTLRRAV